MYSDDDDDDMYSFGSSGSSESHHYLSDVESDGPDLSLLPTYMSIFEGTWVEYEKDDPLSLPNVYDLFLENTKDIDANERARLLQRRAEFEEKEGIVQAPVTPTDTTTITYTAQQKYITAPYRKLSNLLFKDKSALKKTFGNMDLAYEYNPEIPNPDGVFQGWGIVRCPDEDVLDDLVNQFNDLKLAGTPELKCSKMPPVPAVAVEGRATKEEAGEWKYFLKRNKPTTGSNRHTMKLKRVKELHKSERKAAPKDKILKFYNELKQGSETAYIYMIDFECAVQVNKHVSIPCEIAIAKWNPSVGVVGERDEDGRQSGIFHRLIHPGIVPDEHLDQMVYTSVKLTGIPFQNCKLLEQDYKQLWADIQSFLGDPNDCILIQKGGNVDQAALDWIAVGAGHEGPMYSMIEYDLLFEAMGITDEQELIAARRQCRHYHHLGNRIRCDYHGTLEEVDEPGFQPSRMHCAQEDTLTQLYGFNYVLAQQHKHLGLPVDMTIGSEARSSSPPVQRADFG